ncbi:polyprenol phosphomannose-dependent alpha 1,6 mannosyltransferase MptB [Lapillicoccus sp.]|uniref:polyprenol phosphomannose-dependent alpha 1,6 mannosyltransferase MptB n=1 Tax=Lapillicoccus sp. TaxID=1909287 RepID=UPI0027D000AB|nr:polyprenol phosphomannose-dependent alpha 1,6 mannosyltransferase MptB [Actinomycetota bacterium]
MTVDQRVMRETAIPPLFLAMMRELAGVSKAWRIPAVRRGTLGAALIFAGSFTPAFLPDVNPFMNVPVLGALQTPAGMVVATATLVIGVLLLLEAWLRLRPRAGRPKVSRHILWLWSLPLLLAPPLFSRDAYSYAGQGRLVTIGLDPYRYGPAGVAEQYSQNVDPMWLYTPAPYGPLVLQIQHGIVDIFGTDHAYAAAVAMRAPAILGVVLIAVLLPKIARQLGYDSQMTTWLAVLNPLLVLHLVGGAHNDALMLGLMVLGVWLALQKRIWLAVLVVAAAGAIKAPGFLAILAVAALEARRLHGSVPSLRQVMSSLFRLGSACFAVFVLITAICGLGFGWIGALGVPSTLRSALSPPTAVGVVLEKLLMWLQVPGAMDTTVTIAQRVGLVIGLVLAARVAWRLGPVAPVRALAWVTGIIVITNSVVHPWYILWGGLFLAMTEGARFTPRRVMVWVTAGLVVYCTIDASLRNGTLALGVTAGVVLAWMAFTNDRNLERDPDQPQQPFDLRGWWLARRMPVTSAEPVIPPELLVSQSSSRSSSHGSV